MSGKENVHCLKKWVVYCGRCYDFVRQIKGDLCKCECWGLKRNFVIIEKL